MIQDVLTNRQSPASTSDKWHVVHARWMCDSSDEPRFERTIVSEHENYNAAVESACALVSSLQGELATRPSRERDQVFVRKPGYPSLKHGTRVRQRRFR
jgi:N-dimethylarginine dimethylaminohydrolase